MALLRMSNINDFCTLNKYFYSCFCLDCILKIGFYEVGIIPKHSWPYQLVANYLMRLVYLLEKPWSWLNSKIVFRGPVKMFDQFWSWPNFTITAQFDSI